MLIKSKKVTTREADLFLTKSRKDKLLRKFENTIVIIIVNKFNIIQ